MRKFFEKFSCAAIRMWLVPRAEGSTVPVPSVILAWINRHLDYCARCGKELRNLRLTTFALRRAAKAAPRKSVDPYFADRVISRVLRGESARKRQKSELRLILVGASFVLTVAVMTSWIGGLNILQAEWYALKHPITVSEKPLQQLTPYSEHDPFALPAGDSSLTFDSSKAFARYSKLSQPRVAVRPIPDMLSRLWLSRRMPSPILSSENLVAAIPPKPALAPSSYLSEDSHTPPAMIGQASGSSGLTAVIPAPSDPAPDLRNVTTVSNEHGGVTIGSPPTATVSDDSISNAAETQYGPTAIVSPK